MKTFLIITLLLVGCTERISEPSWTERIAGTWELVEVDGGPPAIDQVLTLGVDGEFSLSFDFFGPTTISGMWRWFEGEGNKVQIYDVDTNNGTVTIPDDIFILISLTRNELVWENGDPSNILKWNRQ